MLNVVRETSLGGQVDYRLLGLHPRDDGDTLARVLCTYTPSWVGRIFGRRFRRDVRQFLGNSVYWVEFPSGQEPPWGVRQALYTWQLQAANPDLHEGEPTPG